jgi:hypothetical protein
MPLLFSYVCVTQWICNPFILSHSYINSKKVLSTQIVSIILSLFLYYHLLAMLSASHFWITNPKR